MVSQDRIIEYFADQGVNVKYNTLGGTEDLVRAYVFDYEDVVKNSESEKSQYSKTSIYQSMYDMESRTKLTGFEKLKTKDRQFRTLVSKSMRDAQWHTTFVVDTETEVRPILSYKETLKNYLKTIDNPLLYLSGGIDSELVALAMLDAGVKFNTVIFEFLDNSGDVINKEELGYAYKFINKHNINATVKKLNVEELWDSEEFVKLTEAVQLPSPQLITHAHMINMMSEEFVNHTHLFGGEARFYTHHWLDDGRKASLVLLTKLVTPSYNGSTYSADGLIIDGVLSSEYLNYYYNASSPYSAGSWLIDGLGSVTFMSDSGQWTNATPTGSFEFRISNRVYNTGPTSNCNEVPTAATSIPTSWTTISTPSTICGLYVNTLATAGGNVTYTIEVRSVSTPANLVSSTITLDVQLHN